MRALLSRLCAAFVLLSAGAAYAAPTGNNVITPQLPNRGLVQFYPATSTASSIAASTAVSVTGSIAGNVLTVTAVGSGTLVPGEVLAGTGIYPSTKIVQQLWGTTGGVGGYLLSLNYGSVSSETITSAYSTMTIGGTVTGAFQPGAVITGTGITPGAVMIYADNSGTGAGGTYYVTPVSAAIPSSGTEALNADQPQTNKVLYAAGPNGSKCYGAWETNSDGTATHTITLQIESTAIGVPYGGITVNTSVNQGFANGVAPLQIIGQGSAPWLGLPLDNDGNNYVFLYGGDELVANYATALSSGAEINLYTICWDF